MGTRTGFAEPEKPVVLPRPKGWIREYTETIIVCVIILIFPRAFVFQQSEIPSGSMEDTILIGDYILVNRFQYAPTSFEWERELFPIRAVRRGDVVVFKHPDTPEVDFIKRVIGLPGDSVAVRNGFVYINDERIDEPYVGALYRSRAPFPPQQVAPGHYFVMGDHRNQSSDSRDWGQVPQRLIKGRAFMIVFSTNAGPADGHPPGQVTLTSLLRKLINLVFYARWDRAFTAIR